MYTKGDFHIHSTCSDGGLTPSEIVKLAKRKEVDIISITDHNNTDGIDEAIEEGKSQGIRVIPGVELSTRYNKCRVHVLGYFKDDSYNNELLKIVLLKVRQGNIKELRKIFYNNIDFCGYKDKLCVKTGVDILKFFGATVVLAHPVLLCKKDFENSSIGIFSLFIIFFMITFICIMLNLNSILIIFINCLLYLSIFLTIGLIFSIVSLGIVFLLSLIN